MQDRDHLTIVGEYENFRRANEHALVILSMGLAYWMFREDGSYILHVESEHYEDVLEQIRRYDEENRIWPPWTSRQKEERASLPALLIYSLILVAFFTVQQDEFEWFVARGSVDATEIFIHGEWWRAATALTLHSDVAHLVANLLGGAFFGLFVNRSLGAGFGWFLILLSGIFGNLLSAAISYPLLKQSIGASTAIFGALGILAGCAIVDYERSERRPQTSVRTVPFFGALILLALLGTGDVRTDVLAHFSGFSAGIVFGVAGGWVKKRRSLSEGLENALLFCCLFVLALAWMAGSA